MWNDVAHRCRAALAEGALAPIETCVERVGQNGISFVVRRAEALQRKPRGAGKSTRDPFAPPYDPALVLGDIPPAHVALLNKFPVLSEHLLLVTREYADQRELLTEADFAALTEVMGDREILGFYNGGSEAGASQPHKHLQVVPLPLGDDREPVPLEPYVGRLPFLHAVAKLEGEWPPSPAVLVRSYQHLWRACGFTLEGEQQPVPYNLLVTRRRMWLVPRRQESYEGIEVNALGFAGALLATGADQAALIKRIGPLTLLQRVAFEGDGVEPLIY